MSRGEGIKKISLLFEAYRKRLRAPQRTVEDAFREVVHDVCGFDIKKEYVSYKPASRTLMITAPGPMKTEILLKKDEVLAHLKGRLGLSSAPKNIL